MNRQQTLRFLLSGVPATLLSWLAYELCLQSPQDVWQASIARWITLLVVLYALYSRWVLHETLRAEQQSLGWKKAEAKMIGRVTASLGASTLAKVFLEAPIASLLIEHISLDAALLSPILADALYGPLINYAVLALLNRRAKTQTSPEDPAPDASPKEAE